jgi:formate dehydrogenase accessory protein FdhE
MEGHQALWRSRINRCRDLQTNHSLTTSGLRLYAEVLTFQYEASRGLRHIVDPSQPLRDQIDLDVFCSLLPRILALAGDFGPEMLQAAALRLQGAEKAGWLGLGEAALDAGDCALAGADDFFTRACLQPLAEHLQLQMPRTTDQFPSTCPVCGGLPQMAILRQEGEGCSRSLLCSFCLCEWAFRRVVCPSCGEEDKEKLPRYSAEECNYVHVEACDTCRRYLKALDMTINGHAVPLVDEAALAVLDVWATGRGYTKIRTNLLGF